MAEHRHSHKNNHTSPNYDYSGHGHGHGSSKRKPKISYITVATKPHHNLELLKETCNHQNMNLTVLGQGDLRLQSWGNGFGVKLQCVKDAASKMVYEGNDEDIVLFTDAYDVLLVGNASELITMFESFQSDIVFATENFCHPDSHRASEYPKPKVNKYTGKENLPNRYLNSGTFMGRAGAIHKLFKTQSFKVQQDDQRYWTDIYLSNYNKRGIYGRNLISLDSKSELFMCLAGAANDLVFEKNHQSGNKRNIRGLYKHVNGSKPIFLHFNGDKTDLQRTYDQWLRNKPLSIFPYNLKRQMQKWLDICTK